MSRNRPRAVSSRPPLGPSSDALRTLASGVDGLYLSGQADPPAALLQRLELAKQTAQDQDEPVEFELGGVRFEVKSSGWGKYPYSLEHSYGRVGIRKAGRLPAVRIQTRAEALHGHSPQMVVEFFEETVTAALGQVEWSVSRIDLFVDVQGWRLSAELGKRFVARPKQLVTYMDGEACTGFQFGNRKSKRLYARLYDKTIDIANKGSDWMTLAWGDRYDPALPVHRVEFELHRGALREFQISTPAEVFEAAPDLWRYCTHDWLRLCVPTGDSTRSRWPTDPSWLVVQNAALRQAELGLARVKAKKGAAKLACVIPQLVGFLVSFAALIGTTTLKDTLSALPLHIASYEQRTGRTFAERVAERLRATSFR